MMVCFCFCVVFRIDKGDSVGQIETGAFLPVQKATGQPNCYSATQSPRQKTGYFKSRCLTKRLSGRLKERFSCDVAKVKHFFFLHCRLLRLSFLWWKYL